MISHEVVSASVAVAFRDKLLWAVRIPPAACILLVVALAHTLKRAVLALVLAAGTIGADSPVHTAWNYKAEPVAVADNKVAYMYMLLIWPSFWV